MKQRAETDLGPITASSRAVAASAAKGRELLARRDAFIEAMTPFDRQSRVEIEAEALLVDEAAYLSHTCCQVMPWSDLEIAALQGVIANIKEKLEVAGIAVRLPDRVWFVKTSGREEGGAAYTRNTDTVVLPAPKLAALTPKGGDALHPVDPNGAIEAVTTHELFHVQSKHDPSRRKRLYPIIGYQLLDHPVLLPDVTAPQGGRWPDWKITNPDAPLLDVCIELRPDSEPDRPPRPMTPVLLSRKRYSGGQFFDYVDWSFMVLERGNEGLVPARGTDGGPVLIPSNAVREDYRRRVGRNFDEELFHPDEILAQNFVLIVREPSMALLMNVRSALTDSD